jgi:hypothetical protein
VTAKALRAVAGIRDIEDNAPANAPKRSSGTRASTDTAGVFPFGLRLVAWDATMLDVPDSDDNADAFIRP